MRATVAAMMFAALSLSTVPAQAQFSDGYNFFKAVREKDITKVQSLITAPGSTLINQRDPSSGEMALHIVTRNRDTGWMNFLLQRGASPDVRDRDGNTPLILAATLGYTDGLRVLLARKPNVNAANNQGETALIKAVQARDITSARLLLDAGADPKLTDNIAGMSALDYAEQDRRAGAILRMIKDAQEKKAAPAATGIATVK